MDDRVNMHRKLRIIYDPDCHGREQLQEKGKVNALNIYDLSGIQSSGLFVLVLALEVLCQNPVLMTPV